MHTWERRSLVAVLIALLLAVCGALSAADAVGTGNPEIVSPTSTSALYAGYTGPFTLDFDDAPTGDYSWSVVSTAAQPPALVDDGTYPNDGIGVPEPVSTVPLAAGTYTFTISDVETDTHQDSVEFTVRSGPPPRCSVMVPSKVRVNAPVEKVGTHLSNLCTSLHVTYASWKISHSTHGFTDSLVFDHTSTDTWVIYDGDPMGRYLIQPKSARTSENTDVPQNSPTPLVRRDSRLGFGGSRSGSYVTVRASLSYYSASANGYRPWANKYVALAYRNCSTCAWHQQRTLTTNVHGLASYTFKASSTRDYRVASSGISEVWAASPKYKRL